MNMIARMKTIEAMERAKKMAGIRSNYEFARHIDVAESTLSQYKKGIRVMDDYVAMKIAEILQINPLRMIAQANIEREKNPKKRLYWLELRERLNEEAKKNKEPFSETL